MRPERVRRRSAASQLQSLECLGCLALVPSRSDVVLLPFFFWKNEKEKKREGETIISLSTKVACHSPELLPGRFSSPSPWLCRALALASGRESASPRCVLRAALPEADWLTDCSPASLDCQLVGEGATPTHSALSNLPTHQPLSPMTHLVDCVVTGASGAVKRPSDEGSTFCFFLGYYETDLKMFENAMWKFKNLKSDKVSLKVVLKVSWNRDSPQLKFGCQVRTIKEVQN